MLLLCHLTRSCLACGTIWKCLVSLSSSLEACNSLCKWKCTIFREPFECSCLINEGKIRRGPQRRRETDLHQGWQVFFLYTYLHVDPEYRFFPSFLMFIQIYGVLSALSIFSPMYVIAMIAKVLIPARAGYPLSLLMAHLSIGWRELTQISKKQQNTQQHFTASCRLYWREVGIGD